MIDHQQRHQYLEALGITSWLPATPLPAAAPSDDWVWDFRYPAPDIPFENTPGSTTATPAPAKDSATVKRDAEQARAMLSSAFGTEPEVKSNAAKPQVQSVETDKPVAKPRTKPAPAPKFCLAFVVLGDWLVVDTVPPAGAAEFSAAQRQLLANIAPYLGHKVEQCPEPMMVRWPILANSSLDQSRDQAVAAVQHKLKGLFARQGCKYLLLMGHMAAQMALDLDDAQSIDELREAKLPALAEVPAAVTYSLSEALRLPELKADIWADLQALKKSAA